MLSVQMNLDLDPPANNIQLNSHVALVLFAILASVTISGSRPRITDHFFRKFPREFIPSAYLSTCPARSTSTVNATQERGAPISITDDHCGWQHRHLHHRAANCPF